MKAKFKDLRNAQIKIEKFHEIFDIEKFIELVNEFDIKQGECISNCYKLSHLNLNGFDLEYVECLMVSKIDDEKYVDPHIISYWNGHYFDITLEIVDVNNKINPFFGMKLDKEYTIMPIRRYKIDDLKQLSKYAHENGEKMSFSFVNKYMWVDNNGKVNKPSTNSPWFEVGKGCRCKMKDFLDYMKNN